MPNSRFRPVELLASAARTSNTGNGSAVEMFDSDRARDHLSAVQLVLDVTAAATQAGDKLDVFVQTQLDDTNWIDVVHFTQLDGDGGAKRYVEKIVAGAAEAGFETASALAAGEVRHLIGRRWRVRWVITESGGDDESFTFSVQAQAV